MARHANNFDGLRLIAALLVLWSHMFALSGRPEPMLLGGHGYGNLGVLIFFSISGYLVSMSWGRDPRATSFLAKRVLRIMPALLVAIPLQVAVVWSTGLWGFPDNSYHTLNGSLWTIPYEVFCYFVLLGLSLLVRPAALVMALIWLVAYVLRPSGFIVEHVVGFGLFFSLGWLLSAYPGLLRWWPALAGLGLWVALGQHLTNLGLALIVAPLVVLVGVRSWPVLRTAGRLGDVSYGVYIYAWPVQQLTVVALPDAPYIALLAITLPATLILAWLSWHVVEHPSLQLKPKSGAGRRSAGSEQPVVVVAGPSAPA